MCEIIEAGRGTMQGGGLLSEMAEAELGEAGRQRILHLLPTELIL
jgi:hypothetical protein